MLTASQRILWLFALLWALSGSQAYAFITVDDLYETEVPVADQAADSRQLAVQQALRQVLIKVTGQADINVDLSAAASDSQRLVQQYRYRTDPAGLRLWVRFHQPAVDQLVAQLGLPKWAPERPALLVWLVLEEPGSRRVVSENDEPQMRTLIEEHMARRGVPVLFPLWDLEDRSRVRMADLWGGFSAPILAASRRYGADAVLLVRSHGGGNSRRSRWALWQRDQERQWQSGPNNLMQTLYAGLHEAADRLAGVYAMRDGGGSLDVILEIQGVDSLQAFAAVHNHLSSLSVIQDLNVAAVNAGTLSYRIRANGGRAALAQVFSLTHWLEAMPAPLPGSAPPADLYYRYRP